MGKKSRITLVGVGVVLVLVAIVWWAALAPSMVKLPSNVDSPLNFEGKLTQFMDPATGQALPAGQEVVVPFTVVRSFTALPDLYTSNMGVLQDSIVMTAGGQARPAQVYHYALDRKTFKFIKSDESWAYSKAIVLNDRVGSYGPVLPGGLKVGDAVPDFIDDVNKAFDVKAVEKIDDYNGLGITALKVNAAWPATEYYPPIAQAFLGSQGLPMQITFAQASAQLKAKGLDLEALMTGLAAVATPEDMQALQAMTQQPIKLIYKLEGNDIIHIEQKTGLTVAATLDRTTTMDMDTAGLLQAFGIIGKYASDPTVGPAIANAMKMATQLAAAGSTKVFNQNMTTIAATVEKNAKDAGSKAQLMGLVKTWIPVIVLVIGALLLIIGGYFIFRGRKTVAGAGASKG